MTLWKNYKSILDEIFPEFEFESRWCNWSNSDDLNMTADIYSGGSFIKSRRVDITDYGRGAPVSPMCIRTDIYNNVIYPKTGHNLPCFGMDLMGFFEKKVIIVFDFQHPVEKHLFSVPGLPKAEKDYRFFEMGNHFSENIFVRYCTFSEVDNYLPEFRQYLEVYRKMVDDAQPTGNDVSSYKDFDIYMKKLDPILGYLSNKFGKDKANRMMDEFFFPYANENSR